MYRVAGVVLMIGMGWMSAAAQRVETAPPYAPVEISFNYSYARSNAAPGQCGCFNMNGGSSEVAFHAFRALSVVADLTGERAATIGATAGGGLSLVAFTVGPRFSHRFTGGKFTPFVQGLVGSAHGFDGLFPGSSGSLSGAANARAVLAGGGLDLTINQHIAIRAIQADYLRTQLPNGEGDEQNLLRVSAGIVLRVW
jgi:outer membrane immunogenic protein